MKSLIRTRLQPNMEDDNILSHPEILPYEKLMDILSSRGIPKAELLGKDKDVLVQLFYRFVVPLPQRATNMRRANRLRKSLSPIKSTNFATKDDNRGLKRRLPHQGMEETVKVAKVSKFLHGINQHSPATDCKNQITTLTINCIAKKPLKPVKLNRTFLAKELQTKVASTSPQPNINNQGINISTMATTCMVKDSRQESTSSDSQVDSGDEEHRKLKKFKRITVTWP